MTKAILFITLGLSTMLWANTSSPTIVEKSIETKRDAKSIHKYQQDRIKMKHHQTKQRDRKIEKKHLKAEQKRHMKKMDKKLAHRKARKRNFKTHDEFKHMKRHHAKRVKHTNNDKRIEKHFKGKHHSKNNKRLKKSLRYGYYNDHDRNDYRDYRRDQNHRTHGYRHPHKSWYPIYRYERAPFYDRYGYYYGFFNRHGYLFEGDFYRYDRYYTYRDRVRGKGLFDHRYYRPVIDYYYSSFDDPYYRR